MVLAMYSLVTISDVIIIILLSFAVSALGAAFIARFGHKLSLIDNPKERSSHAIPTPRGGGIGILVLVILIGFFVVKNVIFTAIAGLTGLLGLFEDRFGISSKVRLIIQFSLASSIIILFSGVPVSVSETAFFLFSIIFITGTANFYNFMDGINGIAGLTGVVCFGLMAFFSTYLCKEPDIAMMSIALAAGCLGFLPFNFPNAKVFMGDVGSILLGVTFAAFVIKLSKDISTFLCLIMFLCTFYADATVTIFYRWRKGENLMKAHRRHLYQYLSNELRLPHWQVSTLFGITQVLFGILALLSFQKGLAWQIAVFVLFATVFLISYRGIKKSGRWKIQSLSQTGNK